LFYDPSKIAVLLEKICQLFRMPEPIQAAPTDDTQRRQERNQLDECCIERMQFAAPALHVRAAVTRRSGEFEVVVVVDGGDGIAPPWLRRVLNHANAEVKNARVCRERRL